MKGFDAFTTATGAAWDKSLTLNYILEAKRKIDDIRQTEILPRIRIIESMMLTKRVQFRFSRRHKKRIIKKFARDPRNFRQEPDTSVYLTPFGQICHPSVAVKIRAALKAAKEG